MSFYTAVIKTMFRIKELKTKINQEKLFSSWLFAYMLTPNTLLLSNEKNKHIFASLCTDISLRGAIEG